MLYSATQDRLDKYEQITYGKLTQEELLFFNANHILNDESYKSIRIGINQSFYDAFLELKQEIYCTCLGKQEELEKYLFDFNKSNKIYMIFRKKIYLIGNV